MILFFSGIILWTLILIIYVIPFEGMMTCLGSLVLGGYLFIWYIAAKPWDAQKGGKTAIKPSINDRNLTGPFYRSGAGRAGRNTSKIW